MSQIFKIYVTNLLQTVELDYQEEWLISDLVDRIATQFQFPHESQITCTQQGQEYDLETPVKDIPNQQLNMHFSLKSTIIFEHSKLGQRQIVANLLGNAEELAEAIESQIPFKVHIISKQQSRVRYSIMGQFLIFYQKTQYAFQVEQFDSIKQVKEQITQQLNISLPFALYYDEQELEDQNLYYQFKIPFNAVLYMQIQQRITITIKWENVIKQFQVTPSESVERLKKWVTKIFQLETDYNLFYQNQQLKSLSQLKNNSELLIQQKQPYKVIKVYLESENYQFIVFVKSNEKISILDRQIKGGIYSLQGKELDKNKTFQEFNDEELHIQYKTIMVITLSHKFLKKLKKFPVQTHQNIINLMMETENQKIIVFYKNHEIDPTLSFQQLGTKDLDTFEYCNEIAKVKFSDFGSSIHYFDISLRMKGSELYQFVRQKFKIQDFQIQYMDQDLPLDKQLIWSYHPDIPFQIVEAPQAQKVIVKVYIATFDLEIDLDMQSTATVADIKDKIQAQFNIQNADCILVRSESKLLDDAAKISDQQWLNIDIEERIDLFFKNLQGTILHHGSFSQNTTLKQELTYFCDPDKVRCIVQGKEVDKDLAFMELQLKDNDTIIVEEYQINRSQFFFQRKGDSQKISKPLDIQMTLQDAMLQITQRRVVCFVKGSEVDQRQSIVHIKDVIEYDYSFTVTFTKLGDILATKIVLARSLPQEALQFDEKVCLFYGDVLLNPQNSWEALGILDNCTIQVQNFQRSITIKDELQTLKINAKITSTVKQLREMLQIKDSEKLLYYQDEQLNDETLLYTLTGHKNEIVIECREKIENEDSLHLPVSLEFPLRIKFIDVENGANFIEELRPQMKIQDFIELFKQREGKDSLTLFYDGEEMDPSHTFEQLRISNGAEIEIQY